MKKDITITSSTIDQARTWVARALDATTWLIILGMIGAGLTLAGGGGMFWLVFGNETVLALGLTGGVACCVVGSLALLRRLERSAKRLRA